MSETLRNTRKGIGGALRAVGRFIARHKKLFIFLAIVAAAAIAALVVLGGAGNGAGTVAQLPQTTQLARMDLQQMVAGTGTLQSSHTREVSSTLSYEIEEIYVEEGQQVQAGQLLAKLDTTDIDKDIAEANKNIGSAQESDALALSQAERKLQDAYDTRDLNYAQNDSAIADAKSALDSAESEKDSAKSARDKAKTLADSLKPAEGEEATPEYQQALQEYEAAKATYEQKKAAVQTAESTHQKSIENRDTAYRNDSISIENVQDAVNTQKLKDSADTYRTQLKDLQDSKADCQIEAPVAGTVTAMTAEVGKSAGGAGVAASGSSTGTALFTIEDTSNLEITASIPEYDVVNVRTGMQVKITTDALMDEEWNGSVSSISAKAADSSGNFTVVVEVVSPPGELAIGMSAKINIITQSQADVFAVPYDAVTTDEDGNEVVYILPAEGEGQNPAGAAEAGTLGTAGAPAEADGNTPPTAEGEGPESAGAAADPAAEKPKALGRPIVVQTGMETDYYIEITSAQLQEGMLVLTDPEGKNVSADTPATGMMGMGPMGG